MDADDLRPVAETVSRGLLCALYPALAGEGHDLVVYTALRRDVPGEWVYGARIVDDRVRVEHDGDGGHTLSARGRAQALAWARREVRGG